MEIQLRHQYLNPQKPSELMVTSHKQYATGLSLLFKIQKYMVSAYGVDPQLSFASDLPHAEQVLGLDFYISQHKDVSISLRSVPNNSNDSKIYRLVIKPCKESKYDPDIKTIKLYNEDLYPIDIAVQPVLRHIQAMVDRFDQHVDYWKERVSTLEEQVDSLQNELNINCPF